MTRKLLLRTHFYLILFVLANFLAVSSIGIGFHINILFFAKISFFILGFILFFLTVMKPGYIYLYFLLYLLYPLLTLIAWLINGLLGGVLIAIFLFNFNMPDKAFEYNHFVFYKKFDGLITRCCGVYEIRENKFGIFQKEIAETGIDFEHSFKNSTFIVQDKRAYLRIGKEEYKNGSSILMDTILMIKTKY